MFTCNLRHAAITHPGRRKTNEDAYIQFERPNGSIYAVCDGLGGHTSGEIAAYIATETLRKKLTETLYPTPFEAFVGSILLAHQEIYKASQKTNSFPYYGMGTTIVAALCPKNAFYIAHLGDSRSYLFAQKRLRLLTKDHSRMQELMDSGLLPPDKAHNHPYQNVITCCLGIGKNITPEIRSKPITLEKKNYYCFAPMVLPIC
jgi:protein phosphatase